MPRRSITTKGQRASPKMPITTPTKLGDKLNAFTKIVESGSAKKKKKGKKKGLGEGESNVEIESQIVSEMKEAVDRYEGSDVDLDAAGDGHVDAKKSKKRKRASGGVTLGETQAEGAEDAKNEGREGKKRKKEKSAKRQSIESGFGAAEANDAESVIVKVEGREGKVVKGNSAEKAAVEKESQDTMDIIMAHTGPDRELEAKLSRRERKKTKKVEKAAKKEKEKVAAEEALVNDTISSFMEDTGDEAGDGLDTKPLKSLEKVVLPNSSKKNEEKSGEGAKQTPTVIKETHILPPSSTKSAPAATPVSNAKKTRILSPGGKQPTSTTKIVPPASRNTPASASKSTKSNLQVIIPVPKSVPKSTHKIVPPSPNTLSIEITRRLEAANEPESESETNPDPPIASTNKRQKKNPSTTETKQSCKPILTQKPKVGSATPKDKDEEGSFSQVIDAVKNSTAKIWPVTDLKEKKQPPILSTSKSGRFALGSNSTSASSSNSDVFTSSANRGRALSVTNKGSPVRGGPAPKMGDLGVKGKNGAGKAKSKGIGKKELGKGKEWGHLWQRKDSTGRIRGPAIGGLNAQSVVVKPDGEVVLCGGGEIGEMKVMMCVVQKGVLEVTVGEGDKETKFGIGEGGWWRIRGGERCVVWNRDGIVGAEEARIGVVGLVERN